jgi:hypothetical protein
MAKIPKWQTDPVWAIRRARKRKEKLPEELEKLFSNNPDLCLAYFKDVIRTKNPPGWPGSAESLSDFLIDSICSHYEKEFNCLDKNSVRLSNVRKSAANWILSYASLGGEINEKLTDLFVQAIYPHINSHYDWGRAKASKLVQILDYKINSNLEKAILICPEIAVDYAKKSKKRMPLEIEEKNLLQVHIDDFIDYVEIIFGGKRAPENIELLLTKSPPAAVQYAERIVHGKLPDFIHSSLIMQTFGEEKEYIKESVSYYLDFIKKIKNYTLRTLEDFDKKETVENVIKKLTNLNE